MVPFDQTNHKKQPLKKTNKKTSYFYQHRLAVLLRLQRDVMLPSLRLCLKVDTVTAPPPPYRRCCCFLCRSCCTSLRCGCRARGCRGWWPASGCRHLCSGLKRGEAGGPRLAPNSPIARRSISPVAPPTSVWHAKVRDRRRARHAAGI